MEPAGLPAVQRQQQPPLTDTNERFAFHVSVDQVKHDGLSLVGQGAPKLSLSCTNDLMIRAGISWFTWSCSDDHHTILTTVRCDTMTLSRNFKRLS